ncbi:P-loop containing nucleoside triphosphate hydrolase protein [Mollisia scopiformis]|uniref:p-loop containing nucleoside triphosphate hydrolase protein n=1 Tax=Mollisia scopiformis TaxID=149040 RepID=A0A132B1E4_MOLSC|nr:P-loop containing nucleoside triphosphate hydrolase protein [Mollisia scopiformis]KUJ06202.1 P-loop containing nucleoside triphosphate hydrolase protein [Mollisia scopiformis]
MDDQASGSCNSIDRTFGPPAKGCRGGFDFTLLFEEIFLSLIPMVLVIIVTFFRLPYLFRRQTKVVWSLWLPAKLILYGAYEVITLLLIVNFSNPSIQKTKASVPATVLTLIGYIFLPILSYAEHVKTIRPSLILNVYLLFSLFFDGVRARTLWLRYNDKIAADFTAGLVVKLILVLLEAVEKTGILRPEFRGNSPEATGGIYSRSFFWWLNGLFRVGWSKTLSIPDLFSLDKHLGSQYLRNLLQSSWLKGSPQSRHGLFFMTLKVLKWPLLSAAIPRLTLTALNFCQPFLLHRAIDLSQQPIGHQSTNVGYGLIGAYFLVYVGIAVSIVVTGQFQHITYQVITMVRGGLISMLYSNAMTLSIHTADPSSSMILMSADIERITTGWQTIHELWANVIEVGLAIYLLEQQLGAACAIPLAVAIVSMAGSLVATGLVMARQAMWLEAIEKRISATTAMLSAMKGVKMCGLTDVLSKNIHDLRIDELRISKKFRKLLIWNMGFTYITPVAAPVLTFAVFSAIARGRGSTDTLDTARVFTSLSLFTLLSDPLQSLIMTLAMFMSSVGSFQRIQDFLQRDVRVDSRMKPEFGAFIRGSGESKKEIIPEADLDAGKSHPATLHENVGNWPVLDQDAIAVVDGGFGYIENEPLLSEITISIPRVKLTIIVGPVGCGKSILLKAILGEVPTLSGSVQLSSSEIAFCDQTPWHMNGTVQQSVIGISEHQEDWYRTVLRACSLEDDLQQLSRGDQTPVGSKGISLSGGQSQRISLARAVYARRDIVILDDILCGLDIDTENRIFHNLLGPKGLFKKQNVTVIMTSSSCKRLPSADHIIVLGDDGKIAQQGSFSELNSQSGYVQSLNISLLESGSKPRDDSGTQKQNSDLALLRPSETSIDDMSRRTGDTSVYLFYIKAVGWLPTFIFMVAICAFVFCLSFPTIWVKWWAAANAVAPNQRLGYYLGIYALLGVFALVSLIISCWQLIITMVPRSGENFHLVLLKTVLNAPMSFFSSTDTGITTNRFSQDLMLIDMELPLSALNTFATFILCIAQMILIGVASFYAAISFPIILIAIYLIQKFYLRTSRQLRLLDLETKSPLYSQFMECLSGLATIRAFGWEHAMEEKNLKLLDNSQKPFYLLFAVQRWLTLVLDLIVAAVAVLLIVLVVELRGIISPGFVGVALLNIILFSQSIKMLMTFWTNLETHIGSIARIKSFTSTTASENLPEEAGIPHPSWPTRGAIEFRNVSAEYRNDEPVLKNVSLSIGAGEKVAVCGRTGSGKTSLVLSIFRMIEMSHGSIIIDDMDLSTVPRQEIRSKIIGVPQDSYLLAGSVRMNVDPHIASSDEAIKDVLKAVELWTSIKSKGGLDARMDDIFLSHGQKQLFCLARAMLRPSTILILDEATSSVDSKTDELMQRIIRERFSNHTIIAVAHKLDTILDFDKVVLLDKGVLVEFDSPYELLGNSSSAFFKLYHNSHTEEDDSENHSMWSGDGLF